MADESTDEILEATYRALCEHGFADVTVQDIADKSGKSKATIHYHYDSKHDLFTAFLGSLYEDYTDRLDAVSGDTNREELLALVAFSLAEGEDAPDIDFRTAMLEIKAQAPYDDGFRERLTEFDEYLTDRLRVVVADGVEAGEFRGDVDPETTAEFLVTTIKGAHTRRVAVDHPLDRIRETLVEYVETRLVADGASEEPEVADETRAEAGVGGDDGVEADVAGEEGEDADVGGDDGVEADVAGEEGEDADVGGDGEGVLEVGDGGEEGAR